MFHCSSYRTPLHCSKETDAFDHREQQQKQKQRYLTGMRRSSGAATNSVFKNASLVETVVEDIDSYSSEEDLVDDPVIATTSSSIIDYKNQFSTSSVGKVSKELLTGDNEAFILARKKKWMNAKKGRASGKTGRQKRWKKVKAKGKK